MRSIVPPIPRVPKHIGRSAFLDVPAYALADAGKALTVNPAGDGYVYAAFAAAIHVHAGEDITSGTVADARIAASLSGKTLVTPTIASFVNAGHDHSNAAGGGTLAGYQPLDAELTTLAGLASVVNLSALAGLTGAADKVGYFTGAGALALADFTTVGRNVVGAATQAAARTALGLGTIATEAETGYLLASGARTGATSQAQTFTNGVILPSLRPAADSTIAVRVFKADGTTAVVTVDTNTPGVRFDSHIGVGTAPSTSYRAYFLNNVPTASMQALRSEIGLGASTLLNIAAAQFQVNMNGPNTRVDNTAPSCVKAFGYKSGADNVSRYSNFLSQGRIDTGILTDFAHFRIEDITLAGAATGTISTQYGLQVESLTRGATNYAILTNNGLVVINEAGDANSDMRIEGDTDANLLFTKASTDRVGIGNNAPNNKLDVTGTVQADGLRLDVTPTAETPTPTHTFTISLNGTTYRVPCLV